MKLPRDLSGRAVLRAFGRLGFVPIRQRGSHVTVWNAATRCAVSIPLHAHLDTGTLAAILEEAGVTVAALRDAL